MKSEIMDQGDISSILKHFQKFYSDYEQLQREYGRLRKKFTEYQIKLKISQSSSSTSLSTSVLDSTSQNSNQTSSLVEDLEREKLITKSLNAEIATLIKDRKLLESRYTELLSLVSSQKTQGDDSRLKELENENKELKETIDFVTSENTVLKETEERAFKERCEWVKEKEEFNKVVVWSKHINDKLKEVKTLNEVYAKQIDTFNTFLNLLFDFCCQRLPTSSSSPIDASDLIEEYKTCLDQEGDDNKTNNNDKMIIANDNLLQKKIEIIEKLLKIFRTNIDLPLFSTLNHKNEIQQDLMNNNPQQSEQNSKIKTSELYKENSQLKEQNKCLSIELNELKTILNKRDIPTEEVDLRLENVKLMERLKLKEEMLEKLGEKFARHRQVLEDNYKRSTEEIKTLDNFIAIIIGKLNTLPNDLKQVPQLQELISIINENETETPPISSNFEQKK